MTGVVGHFLNPFRLFVRSPHRRPIVASVENIDLAVALDGDAKVDEKDVQRFRDMAKQAKLAAAEMLKLKSSAGNMRSSFFSRIGWRCYLVPFLLCCQSVSRDAFC